MSRPVPEREPEYGRGWPVMGGNAAESERRAVSRIPVCRRRTGRVAARAANLTTVQRWRRIGVMTSMRAAGLPGKAARQSQRQSRAASSERRTVPSQGRAGLVTSMSVVASNDSRSSLTRKADGQSLVLQGPADLPLRGRAR